MKIFWRFYDISVQAERNRDLCTKQPTLKLRHKSDRYIHYYPRVTRKTYLPVKRIGNKFLALPGDNNGYPIEVG